MPEFGSAPPLVVEREVTASLDEFVRGLRTAFPDVVQRDGEFRVTYRGTVMEVVLRPQAPRVLACLALPVLAVTLRFPGAGSEERAAMLNRLDVATHRGGG